MDILIFSLIVFIFAMLPSIYYLKNYDKIEKKAKEEKKKPINKYLLIFTVLIYLLNLTYLYFYDFNALKYFLIIPFIIVFAGGVIEIKLLIYLNLIYNLFYLYGNFKDYFPV